MKKLLALLIITLLVGPVQARVYRYISHIDALDVRDDCYYSLYFDYSAVRRACPTISNILVYYDPQTNRGLAQMDLGSENRMKILFVKRWFLTNVTWLAIHAQAQEVYGGRDETASERAHRMQHQSGVAHSISELRYYRNQCQGSGKSDRDRCSIVDVTPLLISQLNARLFMDESYFWIGESIFFTPGRCAKYFSLPENPDALSNLHSGWQTSYVIRNIANDHLFGLYASDWR